MRESESVGGSAQGLLSLYTGPKVKIQIERAATPYWNVAGSSGRRTDGRYLCVRLYSTACI